MPNKAVVFENNQGAQMALSENLTLGDLVKMGVIKIAIVKPDTPLPKGWWKQIEADK